VDRFEKYIESVLNGIYLGSISKEEMKEEILEHLKLRKAELIKEGYSEEHAEQEAIRKFGKVGEIRKRFKGLYNPYIRIKYRIREKKFMRESFEWAITILVALFIALSIRSYAFAQTEVRQTSMQNTLFEGQRLIEFKMEYLFSAPKRGDIVIINRQAEKGIIKTFELNTKEFFESFYNKAEIDKKRLIKRVIGIPGDTVDIRNGEVYINGEKYNEAYVKGATFPNGMKFPLVVQKKEYFVMGDNRENSMDSREIGLISVEKIEGKALFRVWPLDKIGSIYK